jgi:hypothetical protein
MRNLLPKKVEHYKVFADAIEQVYKQLRYGLANRHSIKSLDLATMRKNIVDWQANDDAGALTDVSMSYTTWLPVTYDFDTRVDSTTAGYYRCPTTVAPSGISLGYNYPGGNSQNIIDVNAGGCITRINLNPTVNINNGSGGAGGGSATFSYRQSTPATTWTITHSLGFIPNVFVLDDAGVELIGAIDSATTTTLVISFSTAVSGYAYLS